MITRVTATTAPFVIPCPQPVLTVSFPPTLPGPFTVTLADGSVIDRRQLAQVVAQFCPGVAAPLTFVLPGVGRAFAAQPGVTGIGAGVAGVQLSGDDIAAAQAQLDQFLQSPGLLQSMVSQVTGFEVE